MARKHVHEEVFDATPEDVFAALHTPSAIRAWWGASRAIVIPEADGLWSATWGDDEDAPEYITVARMRTFEPPKRIVMGDYSYHAREGGLPFEAEFVVTFEVEPHDDGALLRVTQDGFPDAAEADGFYQACEVGWRNTFDGIRRFFRGG